MLLRMSLLGIVSLLLSVSTVAVAQQPETAPEPSERVWEGRKHRRDKLERRGFRRLPGVRGLDLTEEQRQQHRAIIQRHLEGVKSQREELFKLREKRIAGTLTADDEARAQALRQEIQSAMQGVRNEMENILTPEQRAKLEEFKANRRGRHSEFRKRLRERRENVPLQ